MLIKIPKSIAELEVLLAADYSQVEIRMLAEMSKDKLLIKQFKSGIDIHCLVGNQLTGKSVEVIAKDKVIRRGIKGFHFGIVYGITPDPLYHNLRADGVKITKREVRGYFKKYFSTYLGVARFMGQMRTQGERDNYVETMFGFRRHLNLSSKDERGTYWGNQAVNTPVQGTAHQLVLIAIALLHIKPKTYDLLQKPLMEVHDALYWLTKLRDMREAYAQQKYLLQEGVPAYVKSEFGITLQVPLIADSTAGFCMGSMVEYKGESMHTFLKAWQTKHKEVEAKEWEKMSEWKVGDK